MCMRVCLWEFMCAMDVQEPEDIKRSHWFPQDWHHRQLGAAHGGRGTGHMFIARTVNSLSH